MYAKQILGCAKFYKCRTSYRYWYNRPVRTWSSLGVHQAIIWTTSRVPLGTWYDNSTGYNRGAGVYRERLHMYHSQVLVFLLGETIAEGNTRPRWSLACEYTCVRGWVARVGWPYEWRPRRCEKVTLRVPSQSSTHVYEKASSRREGYCWGNSRSSYRRVIRLPTAHKFSINVNFSLLLPII